jgi:hypothetical protein
MALEAVPASPSSLDANAERRGVGILDRGIELSRTPNRVLGIPKAAYARPPRAESLRRTHVHHASNVAIWPFLFSALMRVTSYA